MLASEQRGGKNRRSKRHGLGGKRPIDSMESYVRKRNSTEGRGRVKLKTPSSDGKERYSESTKSSFDWA